MTIKIKEKEYKIKQTIRAVFLWEQITQRTFEIKSTLDNYIYFYSILLANNADFMGWDEFVDRIDEDPSVITGMAKMLTQSEEIEKLLTPDYEEGEDGKKKD